MIENARTEVEVVWNSRCGRDCRSCDRRGACAAFTLDLVPELRPLPRERAGDGR